MTGFVVRPLCRDDASSRIAYALLPQVKEFTSPSATGADDIYSIFQRLLAGKPAPPIHFAIAPMGGNRMIANVGVHPFQRRCAGSAGTTRMASARF